MSRAVPRAFPAQDEMVPAPQMLQLHAAQRSPVCVLQRFERSHHMNAYDEEPEQYWGALAGFMKQYVDGP
jgi:hypothetical protein